MPNNPEAIIGLKLDSVGIDQAASGAENLAGHLSNVTKEISTIGVGIGVGGLLRDFVAIEGSAARTASYMGSITGGMGGYSGLAQSALGVQARTGIAASQTLGAAAMIASLTGGRGLAGNPAAQAGLLGALGTYGAAYQVNPEQLAGSLGPLLQSLGRPATSGPNMLNMLSSYASAGGMGANFPSYLSGISGMVGSAIGTNPELSKYGGAVAQNFSTLYNQAARGNPAYLNNPQLFQSGDSAASAGLQSAYANPAMMQAMTAAGIGFWQQREGFEGPHGAENARKVLKYAEENFGRGSIPETVWLQTHFGGMPGVAVLNAISKGRQAGAGAPSATQTLHQLNEIQKRAAQGSTTPGANLQRARGGIEEGVFGTVGGGLNNLLGLQAQSPWGYLLGAGGAAKLLGKGGSLLRGLLSSGGAADAGTGAAAGAGEAAAGGGLDLLGAGVAGVAGGIGLGALMTGMSLIDPGGGMDIAGKLTGGGLDTGLTGKGKTQLDRQAEGKAVEWVVKAAQKKYGANWMGKQSQEWMVKTLNHNPYARFLSRSHAGPEGELDSPHPSGATKLLGELLGAQGGDPASKTFSEAVQTFKKTIEGMGHGGRKGASYLSSLPGVNNAAGLQNVSDIVGNNTMLAHDISSMGGSGGSGAQLASSTGGGGMSNVSQASGGGWNPCTLTYYQPSSGGINGKSGGGAWSGHPVTDGTWGCAAPPAFAFGTQIAFSYGGKQVTVTVVDRGGAITGTHFDLLPGPARALGMMSAGVVKGGYKIVKGASGSAGQPSASSGGSQGSSGAPQAIQASFQGSAHTQPATAMGTGGAATAVHVHIDGRLIERQRRLVRGRRA